MLTTPLPNENPRRAPCRAPRDEGLEAAIARVGSIGRLARLLGLAQPTVSAWRRVPPHRVIEIERLTRVSRRLLRPDLYDVPEP
jgi:DNA-binding transcriptional regulator YdaS (Cro superfamily)